MKNKIQNLRDSCIHLFAFIQRWRGCYGVMTYGPGDLTDAQTQAMLDLLRALQKVEELALDAKDMLKEK